MTDPVFAARPAVPLATSPKPGAARETAEKFEAVFLGQMTQLMMESSDIGDEFSGGHGEQMFRGVLAEKLGTAMAARGGIGLAPAVMAQIINFRKGPAMASELIDIVVSLTEIMEEETTRLLAPGRHLDFAEMAAAKIKLVTVLETRMAEHAHKRAEWLATFDDETRDRLAAAIQYLGEIAQVNARVLERQIDLSTEMMCAVATEARRLTGTRSAIYGASGVLNRTELATPISINASL